MTPSAMTPTAMTPIATSAIARASIARTRCARSTSASRPRRGVALMTALWLVVAIAAVALEFSLDARERRVLGMDTSERGVERAAAAGALAEVHARLDYALRVATANARAAILRSSDPWLDVDSLYSGQIKVDSTIVDVRAQDLGTKININTMTEAELHTFFTFVLRDATVADALSEAMLDWRDADDLPRPRGAEKDNYIKASRLALPQNGPFREVEDLLDVIGMTPEIYATVSPYMTTRGNGFINLNTAPAAVLRVLPGMTDVIVANIEQLRSAGRRITSVAQVMQATQRGRPQSPAQAAATSAATQRLSARTTVDTREVELTIIARGGPQSQPARLVAIVERGQQATIGWKQW